MATFYLVGTLLFLDNSNGVFPGAEASTSLVAADESAWVAIIRFKVFQRISLFLLLRRDVEASIVVADEATLLLSDNGLSVTLDVKRAKLQPSTTATKQRVLVAFVDGAIRGVTVKTCPRPRISILFWKT